MRGTVTRCQRCPAIRIHLLGPLEVMVGDRPIAVDTRKALAIVALVAAEGRPFARDELAAMFWPDADDEAARGALRRTLSALRSAVGPIGLAIDRTRVTVDPDTTWVDLLELERLAASERGEDLEAAAALARGPFLAGFAVRDSPDFDDWQAARAARVEHIVGDLLDRLAAVRSERGDPSGAIEAARRRVDLDPLDEPGQRRVMDLLARSGDRNGAIRQYRSLVALFDRELGVAPLRETTDLYDAIREGRLEVEPQPPPTLLPGAAAESVRPIALGEAPLIGRDAESAAIVAAWRASSPSGRVVLLEGEAGIGKTRLAEGVAAVVSANGGVVLAARGYPGERAIAYGPIAELLRAGLASPGGPDRLVALDGPARVEIGRLIDLPGDLRAAGSATALPAEATGSRVRLLDAIAQALAALTAADVPGLVWVDDLHLVDDPTREALAYLARRLTGRPVCLLLAWRREDLAPDAAASVADLARLPDVTTVVLDRLDRDEVAAIVRAMRPGALVDDARIDALATDSEGLPLHVVAAVASGDGSGTELPRSVHALLLERIGSVSETAGQILSAAAIIGRSFELSILRHASGRSEEETIDAVEELMHRGLVREVTGRGSSVRYDFSHGRIRDVALEATSLARRRLIHRRAADALRLDPAGPDRDDLARYALIAAHEREAGRSSEAAAAFLEAADRAEAVFANREAIDHLASALALDVADGAAAHGRIGELRSRLGEYPEAIAELETAAALAEPSDLPGIEVALGRVHRRRGDLAAAASHLGSVVAQPDVGDALRARALVERSLVELRAGDPTLAGRDAQEARELADRLEDPRLAGLAERLVGLGAFARGDLAQARSALERSLDLSADDPDPTSRIAAMTALALVLAADGEVDAALAVADDAIASCRRIGDRHLEAAVENHVADILHEAGRPDDSMTHLKRAVALFADVGDPALERDPGIWALAAW